LGAFLWGDLDQDQSSNITYPNPNHPKGMQPKILMDYLRVQKKLEFQIVLGKSSSPILLEQVLVCSFSDVVGQRA